LPGISSVRRAVEPSLRVRVAFSDPPAGDWVTQAPRAGHRDPARASMYLR
jgi:hypothetical protein